MTAATARGKKRVRDGLSTDELARRLNRSRETEQLLAESEEMGVVERVGGGWKLTADAERRFGPAFRELTVPRDALLR